MAPPRPPAFSREFVSLVWAIVLGGLVWLITWQGAGEPLGLASLLGVISAAVIFFLVLLYGESGYRS